MDVLFDSIPQKFHVKSEPVVYHKKRDKNKSSGCQVAYTTSAYSYSNTQDIPEQKSFLGVNPIYLNNSLSSFYPNQKVHYISLSYFLLCVVICRNLIL